jgi:hypothetical protein
VDPDQTASTITLNVAAVNDAEAAKGATASGGCPLLLARRRLGSS